jgi:rod shape-determining protein MreC
MNRPRTAWICFAIAVGLTVPAPDAMSPWIEELRARAATLFSRPLDAQDDRDALVEQVVVEREDDDGIPVIWSSREHDTLVVGAGWEEGLRRGQIVVRGELFVGFVDRVEAHLARVRLAAHRGTRFGVLVQNDEDVVVQRILLAGDGAGRARPRSGRLLEARVEGLTARRPGATGLLVGQVERDEAGRLAVTLPRADEIGDRVTVIDAEYEQPIPVVTEPLFEARPGPVLARGASGPGRDAFILGFGLKDGVRSGDLVSRGSQIVGVVGRVGQTTSRVQPAADLALLSRRDEEGRILLRGRAQGGHPPVPEGLRLPADDRERSEEEFAQDPHAVHVFRYRLQFKRLMRGLG